ncbi:hypothetical protein JTB14_035825 [Gonioctena quinquepunctata]|nr:hypothetical protein JTB14_035825 [Gonioctena quinquepunctata]
MDKQNETDKLSSCSSEVAMDTDQHIETAIIHAENDNKGEAEKVIRELNVKVNMDVKFSTFGSDGRTNHSSLQERSKWQQFHPNFEIVSLVLIKDDNTALCWKLEKVIKVFPGKDEIVRVVNLKAANGIVERPVSEICFLPINS